MDYKTDPYGSKKDENKEVGYIKGKIYVKRLTILFKRIFYCLCIQLLCF